MKTKTKYYRAKNTRTLNYFGLAYSTGCPMVGFHCLPQDAQKMDEVAGYLIKSMYLNVVLEPVD